MLPGELKKGWAVVTGASSGIGLAFARELARRGHPVLAVARRRERLDGLAREAAEHGGLIEPLTADLQTDDGLASVARRMTELGSIALLVNNAGVATAGDFKSAPLQEELGAVRLNVVAVVTLTHHVLSEMTRRGSGAVINVASVVAFQPFPHFAIYAATKAFVLSFTEALAEEVKGTGVRIVALCPGAARTEIDVFAHNEGLLGRLPSLTPEEIVEAALRALNDGSVVEVVGWLNWMSTFMVRFMPRRAVRWLMGVSVKPPSE
jgi:short-subunit dehydrogenase